MKTTVEIADALLAEARRVAARDQRTVRSLIEEGLRKVLGERRKTRGFRLRKASFKGRGLHPDLAAAGWSQIRDRSYEGRGA